ncbi:uncharacterized protein OCT59_024738 [Rhizophagus irregularis]|uniref:Uncharacterized protein n=2 Tax=Rhizophagus irregularis TaxID=588596 RepID=A0A915ZAE8_9GLOM|nr:hypothetical protein GLOIN_2v1557061 [Rhizophagus irregularis DAOM 181602=DAOM 197198]UZO04351.1 hypothetical protein OCT59_024738 [Rhizophagus irregularis]POG76331.1 hypothetical protein GLOIN_2v1557061 [Rhizophagus irregularis DAOM 181602=DAOM 197198]CAB4489011.1 unnamed protein product [Rhizophagus irregularis]CAB5369306.1 unnamed protein product [Rhizophagus irregularis]CAG8737779.1 8679_t:CDS:1 [Rhizophagus irregularis]|eukprot:XP_025183197.1 hypothetical protein GLOIN_2v1557061 [Rhizophagus irregularis DAOM 181602=DAOM 197198]
MMFVQNLGLLIILLSLINTSYSYPQHRVAFNPRGVNSVINRICIHWYDYHQNEISTECDIPAELFSSKTSPANWSIGYKLSIHTVAGTFHNGPYFWWDGWVNGIYCNDIHFHLREGGLVVVETLNKSIVYDKCSWE